VIGEMEDSPFNQALSSPTCQQLLFVMDLTDMPLERLWCLYELVRAQELEKDIEFATPEGVINRQGSLSEEGEQTIIALQNVDPREAQATEPRDREAICAKVDFDEVKLQVQKLVSTVYRVGASESSFVDPITQEQCSLEGATIPIKFQEGDRVKTARDLVDEVVAGPSSTIRVVLVAPAGSGKTVLSKQLLTGLCRGQDLPAGPPLPLRVPADEVVPLLDAGSPDDILLAWIVSHFSVRDRAVFADPQSFGFSSVVLLLDGLDEAIGEATRMLTWLAQWSAVVGRSVVVTTRPSALDVAEVRSWFDSHNYRCMTLLPFDTSARDDLLRLRMGDEEAERILGSVEGEVDGSPWLWSLRIFLWQRGEQFWKTEPQVIRAALLQLSSTVPHIRRALLRVLVESHRQETRTIRWRQLPPELSAVAESSLGGLLKARRNQKNGDLEFHVVHKRFQEWAVALRVCAEAHDLSPGEKGVAELVSQMTPAAFWADGWLSGPATRPVGELRRAGFAASTLMRAGVSLVQLKEGQFQPEELHRAGFPVGALREAGFDARALRWAGISPAVLRQAGFSDADLRQAGFSAEDLRDARATAQELRAAGFSVRDAVEAGVPVKDLLEAGFTKQQLEADGVNAAQLLRAGTPAKVLRNVGFSAKDLRRAGVEPGQLAASGFTVQQLRQAGCTAKDLRRAGMAAQALRSAGYTADDLGDAGFSVSDLREVGFSVKDLRGVGFAAGDLRQGGFSAAELLQAGVAVQELRQAGFSDAALRQAAQGERGQSGMSLEEALRQHMSGEPRRPRTVEEALHQRVRMMRSMQADDSDDDDIAMLAAHLRERQARGARRPDGMGRESGRGRGVAVSAEDLARMGLTPDDLRRRGYQVHTARR